MAIIEKLVLTPDTCSDIHVADCSGLGGGFLYVRFIAGEMTGGAIPSVTKPVLILSALPLLLALRRRGIARRPSPDGPVLLHQTASVRRPTCPLHFRLRRRRRRFTN